MKRLNKQLLFFASSLCLIAGNASAREMEDFPIAKLRSLDKITARTQTFEAKVGTTLTFGQIFIKVQACRKTPPIEEPESAAFLQVWEGQGNAESEWIFSGWMFASSPGLSHMDHPVYDVWVLDCLSDKPEEVAAPPVPEKAPDEDVDAPEPEEILERAED